MKFLLLIGSFLGSLVLGSYTECSSEKLDKECEPSHNPVCGILIEGLPRTFQNSCEACSQKGKVKGYLADPCKKWLTNCKDQEEVECASTQVKTSCGFQTKGAPITIQHGVCCKGDNYNQILAGWSCEGINLAQFVEREPHLRTDIFNCPDIQSPVCVTLNDGSQVTYNNECDLHRVKVYYSSKKQGACKSS